MSFSNVFDILLEILDQSHSLSSLVCSYYLSHAFINFKSVYIEDLAPLRGDSSKLSKLDNVVPTSEGFVFLLKKNNVYSIAASFAPDQDFILTFPSFDCVRSVEVGFVPQIFETTRIANRFFVVCLRNYSNVSILELILFEWRNSKWYEWPALCIAAHAKVRNFVHFADRKTIVFNWIETINLVHYKFDTKLEKYVFDSEINYAKLPGLDSDLPLHNFAICQDRIVALMASDYCDDFGVFDLVGEVDFSEFDASFNYLYSFPYWFPCPWFSKQDVQRLWDVYQSDLVMLDKRRNKIIYFSSEGSEGYAYDFPLPCIPYKQEDTFEIILGGSRLYIIRSDKTTLLVSPRSSF